MVDKPADSSEANKRGKSRGILSSMTNFLFEFDEGKESSDKQQQQQPSVVISTRQDSHLAEVKRTRMRWLINGWSLHSV